MQPSPLSSSKIFHNPKEDLMYMKQSLPIPSPLAHSLHSNPNPGNHYSAFCLCGCTCTGYFMQICLMPHVTDVPAFFHLAYFQDPLTWSLYQCLISFYGCLWYPFVLIYHILPINSFIDEYLSCFYLLAIANNAITNICVQAFVWILVFNFFQFYTYERHYWNIC